MTSALALGAVVGLGIAIPLGAIGVLLLQTGMTHGWRPAAAGGLGAALVDLTYAAVAVMAGSTVAGLLAGHQRAVGIGGAVVLSAVAVTGARGAICGRGVEPGTLTTGAATTPARMLVRFVGLTAVNPLTVVYFAAVAAGFADELDDGAAKVAFVLGIGSASTAWQLALAAAGALLGARVSPRVRTALAVAGYGVVGGFAVALAVG
jgi:threonine/homoserine/homoserine lactone efflux protein